MPHVACRVHVRRKRFEVFETTKLPVVKEGPRRIQALYAIAETAKLNGLDP